MALEWLAGLLRTAADEHRGHGPRLAGNFMPLGLVGAVRDAEEGLEFTVLLGRHAFRIAVEPE